MKWKIAEGAIFGSAFSIIGSAFIIVTYSLNTLQKQPFVIIIPIIFILVGIIFYIRMVFDIKDYYFYKELKEDPNSYQTDATFEKSSGYFLDVEEHGKSVKKDFYSVKYCYKDDLGFIRHGYIDDVSRPVEEFLKKKGSFKIKCKGKKSILLDDLEKIDNE